MQFPNIRSLTARNMKLGRLYSLMASQADADAIMLSPRALMALSSSHSIGKGRCFSIQFHHCDGMMKEVSDGDDEDDGRAHGTVERNDDGLAVKNNN
ncbi:unnamed protein product [Linum trigynum]|uniref:Uncharacterized protein n=1 Tax=Linum trigynum TaxID=586398 RepID=A0AAV2GD28_9ROSI